MRSGTLAPNLVVGLGEACRLAKVEMESDHAHIKRLSEKFLHAMREEVTHIVLNGAEEHRYSGNLNISFACVEGESMSMALKELAVSSGSACTSASLEPSYVLRAIGVEAWATFFNGVPDNARTTNKRTADALHVATIAQAVSTAHRRAPTRNGFLGCPAPP